MDLIFDTIKQSILKVVGRDIDYSKSYQMSCILFNPVSQTITGQNIDGKFGIITEAKIYTCNPIKYLAIPPLTPYILSFINADPSKPFVLGIDNFFPGVIAKLTLQPDPAAAVPLPISGSALLIQTIP